MFVIQGDLQGQKVNFKVKFLRNMIYNKYKKQQVQYLFFMWFWIENSFVAIHLVIPRTS